MIRIDYSQLPIDPTPARPTNDVVSVLQSLHQGSPVASIPPIAGGVLGFLLALLSTDLP